MNNASIYKLPLKKTFSKVFTEDGNMAFDFPMQILNKLFPNSIILSDEDKQNVVDIINGKEGKLIDEKLYYNSKDTIIYTQENRPFIIVRGWGYLTGTSKFALGLTTEKAVEQQTLFANYIISRLN